MNPLSALKKEYSLSPESSLLLFLAFLKLTFHIGVNALSSYGYFRDEFYYLACSEHLAWGYVDQPPFSIAVLAFSRTILGDSLVALRLLPAVAGATTVYLGGLIARELGGRKFAQGLAAGAVFAAPILLAMNSVYSMNSFDFVVWTTVAYLLLRILKTGNPGLWIVLGIVSGLGLMNKISVAWLGLGIFAGFLFTPYRPLLKTRWPWFAGAVALTMFLPYVLWNIANDFAHLEFIRNATEEKYSSLTPVRFVVDQILLQNPVSLPIWLGGLWFFFFSTAGKQFRHLGIIYLTAFVVLVANQHSKAEYLAPAYPMIFAGGSVWIEQLVSSRSFAWKTATVTLLATSGIILTPLASPVLPVESYVAYSDFLGMKPHTAENKQLAELPQFYADMFGWEELTATVLTVYKSLSHDEQRSCVIYTQNYGEAGSISFLGKSFGLPPVVSGHNNYYLWGPGRDSVAVVIIIGGDIDDHRMGFAFVEEAARAYCRYCMPYENNLPIYVARGLKHSLEEVWAQTKHYD